MKTIWKFSIGPTYHQTLDMPTGFKVRHVGPQRPTSETAEGVQVWAEVDDQAPKVPIDWFIVGTGHPLPPDEHGAIYCGTATMGDGYVWHVFCAVPEPK